MEQDQNPGGDELPTYEDLAAQHGPNSRFGRWKSWVEKRAAERYAEDTPERRQARRMRGWGPHVEIQDTELSTSPQVLLDIPDSASTLSRTQTVLSSPSHSDVDPKLQPSTHRITVSQALPSSHLRLNTFGSRFLPHSELPILSLLPLFNHQKLLIGNMDGLTLLDMAPEVSPTELDSIEPQRRDIWIGEGVYQLTLLEHEQPNASGTPQGVVLALVGAEPPEGGSEKESKEPFKAIRMYNLSSLASVASWTAFRKDHKPLDLSRPVNGQPQQSSQTKKHKHRMSRGLKSLKNDSTPSNATVQQSYPFTSSGPPLPPKDPHTAASSPPKRASHYRGDSAESWDVVDEDLPLRWATDYVPLASPSSRLANQSVLFFELHRSTDQGHVTARLAVATRQNILLYETMRGERAFRFVKEFYTPIPARSATFIYQTQHDSPTQSNARFPGSLSQTVNSGTFPRSQSLSTGAFMSESSSRRASSPNTLSSLSQSSSSQSGQLSLFVIFEKKAGVIRLSDSSVGEIDLWEEKGHSRRVSGSPISGGSFRRSMHSLESLSPGGSSKDWKGPWAPPAEATVPLTPTMPRSFSFATETVSLYFLTRGKHTHIVSSPLPMPLASQPPLKVLKWEVHPTRVVPRVCERPNTSEPFLQVTALSEDGVAVQEFPLTFLSQSKGKAKAREDDTVIVQAEVGPGGAGFLCMGGHWTDSQQRRMSHTAALRRQPTTSTVDTLDLGAEYDREMGFYAWTQKGYDDWRVFWLGGDANDEEVLPVSP